MIVLYDSQIFGMQDYGGISRYFSELINRLPHGKVKINTPPLVHNNHYLSPEKNIYRDRLLNTFKYRNYLYSLVNFVIQIPTVICNQYDILHPTYYEIHYPRVFCRQKIVVTVYDLVHEKLNQDYQKLSSSLINKKKRSITRADRIIAISENTKKDLIEIYNVPAEKIDVVYLGNSLESWDNKKKLKLPKQYILFVGQRWLYKNFTNFLPAASKVVHKNPNINIVCAGGGKFTSKEKELIKKLKISSRIIHIPFSSDRDLSEIYARSTLFVYPSLYEGFGIPILEAFSSKTPIAISNTSCFPEIAGKAAVYFDPKNENSIYDAINKVVSDKKLQESLVKLGSKRLKTFSWDKTAKQTAEVYKKVLNNNA